MTTQHGLFECYHSFTGRPDPRSSQKRDVIFRSFSRVWGRCLPPDRNCRILDAGCGEGWALLFLRELGYRNLAGFDLSAENVQICRDVGLNFVEQHDLLNVHAFEIGKSFDVILALDVLEHIDKAAALHCLRSLRMRLARDGVLIVQTPNMGCVFGLYHRYCDLSHEFALTEASARHLFRAAGFHPDRIDIRPAWNAATTLGRLRELYLRILQRVIFSAEDSSRPRIPTKNLLIVARA